MTDRSGRKRRWDMMGGNTTWVDPATARNLSKIYNFLRQRTREALRNGSPVPMFTYSQIARATGVRAHQVQLACQKMAFRVNPHFQITAIVYPPLRGSVRTVEKVKFVGGAL